MVEISGPYCFGRKLLVLNLIEIGSEHQSLVGLGVEVKMHQKPLTIHQTKTHAHAREAISAVCVVLIF